MGNSMIRRAMVSMCGARCVMFRCINVSIIRLFDCSIVRLFDVRCTMFNVRWGKEVADGCCELGARERDARPKLEAALLDVSLFAGGGMAWHGVPVVCTKYGVVVGKVHYDYE